jgi:DNA-binding IclR family transcriptional regulator
MSNLAVERALILLRYILDREEGLSIREASGELGYSPATVQNIINALNAQGFVVQDKLNERYHLGPEAINWGLGVLVRLKLGKIARPYMEDLSNKSGETVFLAVSQGYHAIYIDKVVSNQELRTDAPVGAQRPYNCTAVGKILLQNFPDEKIEELARMGAFEAKTEKSLTDVAALKAEIEEIRKRGWARDNEEFQQGAGCVAAPIYNHEGNLIAALTVSGPAARISEHFDDLLVETKACAQAVSEAMGYLERILD